MHDLLKIQATHLLPSQGAEAPPAATRKPSTPQAALRPAALDDTPTRQALSAEAQRPRSARLPSSLRGIHASPLTGLSHLPSTRAPHLRHPMSARAAISADAPGGRDDDDSTKPSSFEADIALVRFAQSLDKLKEQGQTPQLPADAKYKSMLAPPSGHDLLHTQQTYPLVLGPLQQLRLHVDVDDDGLLRNARGDLLDTDTGRAQSGAITKMGSFLMDPQGNIFVSLDRHPVSPFATAAGRIGVKQGRITSIQADSEIYHSQPRKHIDLFLHELATRQVPMSFDVQHDFAEPLQPFSEDELLALSLRLEGEIDAGRSRQGDALLWRHDAFVQKDVKLVDFAARRPALDQDKQPLLSPRYHWLAVPSQHALLNTPHQYPIVLDKVTREALKVTVRNGLLLGSDGLPMDTRMARSPSGESTGLAHYAMDGQRNLYVSCVGHPVGKEPMIAAGKIRIRQGVVKFISPESALYESDGSHLMAVVEILADKGVRLGFDAALRPGVPHVIDADRVRRIKDVRAQAHAWRLDDVAKPLEDDLLLLGFYQEAQARLEKERTAPASADGLIDVANVERLFDPSRPYPTLLLHADTCAKYEVRIQDGLLYDAHGKLLDTTATDAPAGDPASTGSRASFVLDRHGRLFMAQDRRLISPDRVIAAGEMSVAQGRITLLSRQSDLYRMGERQLDATVAHLVAQGVAPQSLRIDKAAGYAVQRSPDALPDYIPDCDIKLHRFVEPAVGNDVLIDITRTVAKEHIANGETSWSKVPMNAQYKKLVDIHNPDAIDEFALVPTVSIDTPEEKADTQAKIIGGVISTQSGEPWDTRQASTTEHGTPGRARFLMLADGSIHISNHAQLVTWEGVAAAGEMAIEHGRLKALSLKSAVYKPGSAQLDQVVHRLLTQGVPLSFAIDKPA